MQGSLYRPLGLDRPSPLRPRRGAGRVVRLATGTALLLVAAGLTWTVFDGQPSFRVADALAPIPAPVPTEQPKAERAAASASDPVATAATLRGDEDLDGGFAAEAAPATRYAAIAVSDPGSLRQPAAEAHRPAPGLVEDSAWGPLPRRSAEGLRPLDVYAGAPGEALGTRIAIVVGGLGLSQTGTKAAIERLPKGVTLAFAPAGNSLDRWMQEARRDGRELMMQAPMEPIGYPAVTPGPNTLTAEDARDDKFDALYAALGRTTNYVGVVNYMGAALTADGAALEALLSETDRRGLLFLDDGSSPRSKIRDLGALTGAPFAVADVVVDRANDPAEMRRQLDLLERIARAQGSAIGVASAFDTSIAAIGSWAREARERGIEIVPLSQLAVDPERG
ncbi:divergent polysaccharide deacetylase family protein [Antarcticirhabdus aurantiaca]|uniref:Divergent polysaccharide deacetylase family protein n=1 Tax=Antarcticirhabdus aurantiaca TaxID=2606717 RepID=A0ACD4NJH5_9HYPH|nr:divergent polysaccharide deacetylase family protein [Antarcticirhabdus aurantiaca]WAJ26962.1 divergent polysaccharide deacetylase family protein [Jeongeuplla avenae]